jgi:hypothetical protein
MPGTHSKNIATNRATGASKDWNTTISVDVANLNNPLCCLFRNVGRWHLATAFFLPHLTHVARNIETFAGSDLLSLSAVFSATMETGLHGL